MDLKKVSATRIEPLTVGSKGQYVLHYTINLKNLLTEKIAYSNLAYLFVMVPEHQLVS